MKTNKLSHTLFWMASLACAAALLLSACQPASLPTPAAATQPPAAATEPPQPTAEPVEATQGPAELTGEIALDLAGVAQSFTVETAAADPGDGPARALPEHRVLTLSGYPVTDHLLQPRIYAFKVADLQSSGEAAAQVAAALQALLETRQPGEELPFLPLVNAVQVVRAQVAYLEFENGSGVRYLTQFNQGIVPVNNRQLVYTFQGLTRDGQYYIAAVLPVTHPDLPASEQVTATTETVQDYAAEMEKTVQLLDEQPADSFTPGLAALDALVQSIEVK